jgi:chromosome segregation ATPase
MAGGLQHNTTLLSLNLSDVGMMDEGASAFAAAISTNPSLQRLYLASNKITDNGGALLGKALMQNKNLAVFSLRNNELRDATAEALLECLAANTTVSDLDVSYNDFSYRASVKLMQTIEDHKKALNSNVADIAARHVEWLREEEERLFDYRAEIQRQEAAIENITRRRDDRLAELARLKAQMQAETDQTQAELAEVRAQYDTLSDERRDLQQDYNNRKQDIEMRQAVCAATFHTLATKRQYAQVRVSRAESRRREVTEEHKNLMHKLKQEMINLYDQLQAAVQDALSAQVMMLEQEERQKEEQRLAEAAANPDPRRSGKKKKTPKKGKKESEQRPSAEATPPPATPEAKAVSRARTALAKAKPK